MKPINVFAASLTALAMTVQSAAAEIPDLAQALLDAAYEKGVASDIMAVADAAKTVFPDYADAIDAQAAAQIAILAAPAETEAATPVEEAGNNIDEGAAPAAPTGGFFAVRPWEGKFQASAVMSSGNSENAAVGVAFDAARTTGRFVHNLSGYFDLGRSEGLTNQKRWGGAYQLDYKISDPTYAYARVSFDEDEFSGFDYRLFAGAGLGHFLSDTERLKWKIEGGPGFRYSPIDDTTEIDQEFAVYGASETDWQIRDGLLFEQDFNVTWTSPTTTFQSITSLTTELYEGLATGISFELRYETDPPFGRENTDTIARASLVYSY